MPSSASPLEYVLSRSNKLEEAIFAILGAESYSTFDSSSRTVATLSACLVSIDHSRGLRLLMHAGLSTPATSLMRLQFEALTRAVWLLWGAPDSSVEKVRADLTTSNEQIASKLPGVSDMLKAIDGKAPSGATQMLKQFKDIALPALHSFVHGGIHPLKRQVDGYPIPLAIQVIKSSNGLLTMTGMVLANLSGDQQQATLMGRTIQPSFADCLPDLLIQPTEVANP